MTKQTNVEIKKGIWLDGAKAINIMYKGKLIEKKPEEVYVRLGTEDECADLKEVKMNFDIEKGIYTAIVPTNALENKLNLSFKDNTGDWDNNNGKNYTYEVNYNKVDELKYDEGFEEEDCCGKCESCDCKENEKKMVNEEIEKVEDTKLDDNNAEKLEQSLLVIDESKKSLLQVINEPINFNKFIEALSKLFDTIKEAFTKLTTKSQKDLV